MQLRHDVDGGEGEGEDGREDGEGMGVSVMGIVGLGDLDEGEDGRGWG